MTRRRRARKRLWSAERSILRLGAMVVFAALFGFFVLVGLSHDLNLVVAASGIAIFIMAGIVLPKDKIKSGFSSFASGEAGETAHDYWCKILPWRGDDGVNPHREDRRRRGSATVVAIAVITVAVLALALLAGSGAAATTAAQNSTCETEVVHDDFLHDEATVQEVVETGNASAISDNTRVTIEDTDAFLRVKAENPNAYCTRMKVRIHPDIVSPANVGAVDAKSEDVSSEWKHVHDFDADESYTEVTFTLPPDSEVTFAPNTIRTKVINFKDRRETMLGELVGKLPGASDDPGLEQRTYELSPENSSFVTVKLSDGDRQVEEYQAFYRLSAEDSWKPVTTDSSDPVFRRNAGPDDEVQFVFNNEDATVEFTANPTLTDKTKADYRSLKAGLEELNPKNWSIGAVYTFSALAAAPRRSVA